MKLKVIFGVVMMLLSSISVAGNPVCTGTVSKVSISGSGGVHAHVKNEASVNLKDVLFCNLHDESTGQYESEACKGVLSMLMAGAAMNKTATLWFKEAEFTSCTESWVNLKNIGLYHFRVN